MHDVNPRAIIIAETQIIPKNFGLMLEHLGSSSWFTDAHNDGEALVEAAGRLCYRSFDLDNNKNLSKVREGNELYIGNLLKQKHGSVLEHSNVTVAILDVSRILTHELVRHRAGAAYSQESGRFVRMEDIGMYYPRVFSENDPTGSKDSITKKVFNRVIETCEDAVADLTKLWELDEETTPFALVKKLQSAIRRIAPFGHSSNLICTANHRAWRHMIAARTSPGAEEEIQKLFVDIGTMFKTRYPAIYQDMKWKSIEGSWVFTNEKV